MLLGLILADEDHPARSRAELRNTFCQRWNSWWVLFSFSLEMLKQKTWRCITGSKWLSMGYMYCIWTNGKWLQTIGGWWTLRLRKRGGYGLLVKTRVHWWAPQFLLNGCPLPTYICIIYIYIYSRSWSCSTPVPAWKLMAVPQFHPLQWTSTFWIIIPGCCQAPLSRTAASRVPFPQ